MNKLYFVLLIAIIPSSILSQASSFHVITTSGNNVENNVASISWTLGEITIETLASNNAILTQGFQQSNLFVTSLPKNQVNDKWILVYPNPTDDLLIVEIKIDLGEKIILDLIDATGRKLINQSFEVLPTSKEFYMNQYPDGIYTVKIRSTNYLIYRTFQIVKISK